MSGAHLGDLLDLGRLRARRAHLGRASCWLVQKARSWPSTCAPTWTGGKSHNVARRAILW